MRKSSLDGIRQSIGCPCFEFAEDSFDLRPEFLNRVQIRAVRWRVKTVYPERADRYKTLRKRNYGAQKPSARPANAARQGRERPAFAESRNFSLHQRRKCVAERNPCRNDYRARRETQGTGRPL